MVIATAPNWAEMEESRVTRGKYDSGEVADLIGRWLNNDESVDAAEIWTLLRVPNFLEDVALTVDVGKLEPELVWRTLAGPVQAEWEFWQQSVPVLREDDPWTWRNLEKLAADLRAFSYVPAKRSWWQRMSRKRATSATS